MAPGKGKSSGKQRAGDDGEKGAKAKAERIRQEKETRARLKAMKSSAKGADAKGLSKEVLAARKKIKEDSKRAKKEAQEAQERAWKEQKARNKAALPEMPKGSAQKCSKPERRRMLNGLLQRPNA